MPERKVCVITGSSSGIGATTARLYARNGWDVVINYAHSAAQADEVAAQCATEGAGALVVRADVASDADCRELARAVQARFGRADVLINNAGTTKFVPAHDLEGLDAADFQRIYAVNVIGAFQAVRAFAPLLRAQAGAGIVNISSMAAVLGGGSSVAYSASKGALNTLTLTLARALGPQIRVNAIAPGLVETNWLVQGLGEQRYAQAVQAYRARAVLDAVIAPEDVAQSAWYLGAVAIKTTGEVLLLDAGARLTRG